MRRHGPRLYRALLHAFPAAFIFAPTQVLVGYGAAMETAGARSSMSAMVNGARDERWCALGI